MDWLAANGKLAFWNLGVCKKKWSISNTESAYTLHILVDKKIRVNFDQMMTYVVFYSPQWAYECAQCSCIFTTQIMICLKMIHSIGKIIQCEIWLSSLSTHGNHVRMLERNDFEQKNCRNSFVPVSQQNNNFGSLALFTRTHHIECRKNRRGMFQNDVWTTIKSKTKQCFRQGATNATTST